MLERVRDSISIPLTLRPDDHFLTTREKFAAWARRTNRDRSCTVTRTGPGIFDWSTSFSALRYWIWRRRSP
jgi:hypothetical protein